MPTDLSFSDYRKLIWNFRTYISWESPDLHQTNSMWQAILSNLLVPCWFQFHSLHHAEFMRQAFLSDYQKLLWFPGISNSQESSDLHQTNSMWQATLSDLRVHCWFQFHSLHHADSMLQANLFSLLVSYWQQSYLKPDHCIEHNHLKSHHCNQSCSTNWPLDLQPHQGNPGSHFTRWFTRTENPHWPLCPENYVRTWRTELWSLRPPHPQDSRPWGHQFPFSCSQFIFSIFPLYCNPQGGSYNSVSSYCNPQGLSLKSINSYYNPQGWSYKSINFYCNPQEWSYNSISSYCNPQGWSYNFFSS